MCWGKDGADKMARLLDDGKVVDFLKSQKKEAKLYAVTKQLMKITSEGLKTKNKDNPSNLKVFKIEELQRFIEAIRVI